MSSPQPPLFDSRAQSLRQSRAAVRQSRARPFLAERAIADLSDRLQDVSRTFGKAALVGPFDWRDAITAELPRGKIEAFDWLREPGGKDYDLVTSLLHMQSIDDLPGWMRAVRAMLKPDGLFIGAMVGGASLAELRQALYAVDTATFGAPTPRIHPMVEVRQAAPLLSHAGLALPVVDGDRFSVSYRELDTLIGDLRDLGLTNALTSRQSGYPGKSFKSELETSLRSGRGEPLPISWEIVWLTGWSPHESQQTPLKPGSAKTGLNAALRQIRDGSGSE